MINEDKFSTSAAESKATYESESQDNASEDLNMRIRNLKCGFRRKKHNKVWTLAEVMKLIEGVSQCGVGRWIEIKKHSFPAFAFRNSIDLKVLDASHFSMLSQICLLNLCWFAHHFRINGEIW